MNDSVYISEGIEVNKSVVIDGQGCYVTAKQDFASTEYAGKTLTSMFNVFDPSVSLTLKNVTVDGGKVSRGVSMFHGQLTIDGAVVTNGKKIKAAGGIASVEDAEDFINLGASRLGTSRIVKIVKNEQGSGY